jgi:drug/metabolite transporter (DMT)-like permease
MNPTDSASRPADRFHVPWQVTFLLLAAIWGCSFWWIKLGLQMLAPLQVAFVRLAIGAVALAIVAFLTGARLPRGLSTWRHLLVVALLMNSIPFTLFAVGETQISSILAGIINAMTPLTTLAVILLAFPEEQPTAERVAGLIVGFAGALVVVGIWQGLGANEWTGILACLGAVTGYGVAFPYVRRHLSGLPESGVGLATGQITCGALVLLPLAVAAGPLPGPIAVEPIAAMLGLGTLGSGIAFALNYQVVREVGSSTASTVTYLTPLFAVIVGLAFLGETLSWNEPVGGLLIVAGVAIAQGRASGFTMATRRRLSGLRQNPAIGE